MKAPYNAFCVLPIITAIAIAVFAAGSCSTANKIREGKTSSRRLYDSMLIRNLLSFITWKHYTKDSPLLESGLIGPVRLVQAVMKEL